MALDEKTQLLVEGFIKTAGSLKKQNAFLRDVTGAEEKASSRRSVRQDPSVAWTVAKCKGVSGSETRAKYLIATDKAITVSGDRASDDFHFCTWGSRKIVQRPKHKDITKLCVSVNLNRFQSSEERKDNFDAVSQSNFHAVQVLACEAVMKSKKRLQFTLDDGTGTNRTILSGIHV